MRVLIIIYLLFSTIVNAQIQIGNDIDGLIPDEGLGYNCSLSQDGNRLIVSSPSDSTNGYQAGKVAIYQNINDNWIIVGNPIYGFNSVN